MPSISKRAESIQASPLRKLAGVAQERKKTGIKVFHLNIGQPDMETPQEYFDALHAVKKGAVEYSVSQGLPEMIDAWRGYYSSMVGVDLAQDNIVVTCGGSEALTFSFAAVCDPGDNVIVFEPFYTNYNAFGTFTSAEVRPVATRLEDNFHLPTDEEIEKAIDEKTRAILICNPGNPTGTVYRRDEIDRLMKLAKKHNLFVISDEVYREFAFEQKAVSALEYPEMADSVIVIDSASKRFNACGVRIGVLVSKNEEVMTAATKFAMSRLAAPTIEQQALIPVLNNAAALVPPVVEEYRKRRDVVFEVLSTIPGLTVSKPEGAFYNICGLPVESAEDFVLWMISEFEDNGETVLVAPAPGFYATPGKGGNEIRLAYVLDSDHMRRALELLKLGLEQYQQR